MKSGRGKTLWVCGGVISVTESGYGWHVALGPRYADAAHDGSVCIENAKLRELATWIMENVQDEELDVSKLKHRDHRSSVHDKI